MLCRPSSEGLLNSVKEGAEVLDANVINNGMLIWEFVLFCNSIQKGSSKSPSFMKKGSRKEAHSQNFEFVCWEGMGVS